MPKKKKKVHHIEDKNWNHWNQLWTRSSVADPHEMKKYKGSRKANKTRAIKDSMNGEK